MNPTLAASTPKLSPRTADGPTRPDDFRGWVRRLVGGNGRQSRLNERRGQQRYPFPRLLHLTPVDEDSAGPVGDTIVAVGRQLSEEGLDFYHREPLPYRRVIATIQQEAGPPIGLLLDLTWCRFNRYGWYDSGGRFLQVVPSPVADRETTDNAGL